LPWPDQLVALVLLAAVPLAMQAAAVKREPVTQRQLLMQALQRQGIDCRCL